MPGQLTLQQLSLKDKKVLMRVDFNVPLDSRGNITDNSRIVASLPSISYILEQGASLILMSHLGRPKGNVCQEFTLAPCAKELSTLLDCSVQLTPDCTGEATQKIVNNMQSGEVVLLENLRFYSAEESPDKDPSFAKKIASYGDIYINDAFGTSHRKHSSVVTIPSYFPNKSAAGFLLEKEINFLGNHLKDPQRPFCALIGGAKISSKLGIIKSLIKKVDSLIIGGGMAFTFLKALRKNIGNSLVEDNLLQEALEIISECKKNNIPLILPQDCFVSTEFSEKVPKKLKTFSEGLSDDEMGLDIGTKTIEIIQDHLKDAKTILWNGPLGVTEMDSYAQGTLAVANFLSSLEAIKIVGGGDSIAAIKKLGVEENFTHISTGGGACLEFIEHNNLPGTQALSTSYL
jgi:phosphoglycerate kinase